MYRHQPLKVAFFGSSLVSSYWNGAATYYRGIIKALAQRGHEITFYEPDAFERQKHRDIDDPDWAKVVVYQPDESSAREALNSASNVDVIVKASGVGVLDEWLEREFIAHYQDTPNLIKIFWDVDAPATLERIHNDPQDPFRALIPHYDFVLTYGGGQPVIDAVSALPDQKFILGGSGWDSFSPQFPNLDYLGHVYTRDHNQFNCSALAVLNINRDSMARNGFSPPTRVFEAAGAGACLIMDHWEGVEQFLEPDKEVLVATSGDDVVQHLRNLTPEKAKKIGAAARERMLAEHTYQHRATEFEALMNEDYPSAAIA